MKKIIAIFILAFMLTGVLVGCGAPAENNDQSAGGGENQLPDNESGETEAEGEGNLEDETDTEGSADVENSNNGGSGEDANPEGDSENAGPDGEQPDNGESDKDQDTEPEKEYTVGYQVGNLAPSRDVESAKGGTVNIEDYRGKVVVINLWGEWCYYCRVELPDFDRVASEYENVVVIAIHSDYGRADAPAYISSNFPSSEIIFAYDNTLEEYYGMLGGTGGYPRTLVLDENGVITYARAGAINYDTLATLVENAGAVK